MQDRGRLVEGRFTTGEPHDSTVLTDALSVNHLNGFVHGNIALHNLHCIVFNLYCIVLYLINMFFD